MYLWCKFCPVKSLRVFSCKFLLVSSWPEWCDLWEAGYTSCIFGANFCPLNSSRAVSCNLKPHICPYCSIRYKNLLIPRPTGPRAVFRVCFRIFSRAGGLERTGTRGASGKSIRKLRPLLTRSLTYPQTRDGIKWVNLQCHRYHLPFLLGEEAFVVKVKVEVSVSA